MNNFEKLLLENKAWTTEKTLHEREYFERLSKDQTPDFLWIGCSDSRVPAEIIVNAQPGEIFVHRNIANQVLASDANSMSVVQYAVDVLKVGHVVVCGHYNCGGIKAALSRQRYELLLVNKWLMHIKDVYRLHQAELDKLDSNEARANRLSELNVIEQVQRLSHTSIIQNAWRKENRPMLHGWIYGLNDGVIKQLITLPPGSMINPIFQYQDLPDE